MDEFGKPTMINPASIKLKRRNQRRASGYDMKIIGIKRLLLLAVIGVTQPTVVDVGNRGPWGGQGNGIFTCPAIFPIRM